MHYHSDVHKIYTQHTLANSSAGTMIQGYGDHHDSRWHLASMICWPWWVRNCIGTIWCWLCQYYNSIQWMFDRLDSQTWRLCSHYASLGRKSTATKPPGHWQWCFHHYNEYSIAHIGQECTQALFGSQYHDLGKIIYNSHLKDQDLFWNLFELFQYGHCCSQDKNIKSGLSIHGIVSWYLIIAGVSISA